MRDKTQIDINALMSELHSVKAKLDSDIDFLIVIYFRFKTYSWWNAAIFHLNWQQLRSKISRWSSQITWVKISSVPLQSLSGSTPSMRELCDHSSSVHHGLPSTQRILKKSYFRHDPLFLMLPWMMEKVFKCSFRTAGLPGGVFSDHPYSPSLNVSETAQ